MLKDFRIIALTHKNAPLEQIGKFHLPDDQAAFRLEFLKTRMGLKELVYLSTCNRVEFLFVGNGQEVTAEFLSDFFLAFNAFFSEEEVIEFTERARVFNGEDALIHLLEVASSIDSLVVGEREIITQVRNAYEQCAKAKLSGDFLRLVIKKTIETAKEVYTQTEIAKKPVSVVSLAYRKLRELNVSLDARIVMIGAGATNASMAKYLKKHGYKNFTVFNRTFSKAQELAGAIGGEAFSLDHVTAFNKGFDVIVSCTGAAGTVITKEVYKSLLNTENGKKVVIDLAIPNDFDIEILEDHPVSLIAVNNLQEVAKENLREREKELIHCRGIIEKNASEFRKIAREREVELAMKEVPRKIKEIRDIALSEVFAKEIDQMDQQSKEVLDRVLEYMEKKYISVPMKMARKILVGEEK